MAEHADPAGELTLLRDDFATRSTVIRRRVIVKQAKSTCAVGCDLRE